MFGLLLFIFVLSFVVRLFTRPFYGYYRPWIYPFGGWGLWGDILAIRFVTRILPIICIMGIIMWAMN